MQKKININTVKLRTPKFVVCPDCGVRQPFKKKSEYFKLVKDLSIDKPMLLRIQVIYAKCLNSNCPTKCFALPNKFERYQRATDRLKQEAVASLIDDNSTCLRTAKRLTRAFNITGSKSTIDRWKHEAADRYSFKYIIKKLKFSGILCIDEYKPKRSKTYDLIASDARRDRILYLESIPYFYSARAIGSVGRGYVENFILTLKGLGIKPWAAIFDLAAVFPKQIKKVYPKILIQFDHFHVIKEIQRTLSNAILHYRRELKTQGLEDKRNYIWEHKWRLLKNIENWDHRDHKILEEIFSYFSGTIIEKILIFKEQVRDIFNNSKSKLEAYHKSYLLAQETYWRDSFYLAKIMKFLLSWKF